MPSGSSASCDNRSGGLLASIVIPAYNAESTIDAAIRSALAQQGAAYEVIVVDDGSTDRTLDVARRLGVVEPCLTVITQPNTGTAGALNVGFACGKGEYIAALGADDELTHDYLETMAAFIREHPGCDIYGPDIWIVRDGLRARAFRWNRPRTLVLDDILGRSLISGGGTFIRRALFERLGGFRELSHSEDYDFWLRALASGARHIYVPKPLYLYNQSSGQITSNATATLESDIEIIEQLLRTSAVDADTRRKALAAIAERRVVIQQALLLDGRTKHQIMVEEGERVRLRLRSVLSHVLPSSSVDRMLSLLHSCRWIARPFRRMLWRIRFLARERRAR